MKINNEPTTDAPPPTKPIEEMTIDELKQLQMQRYNKALMDATLGKLHIIAEQLGETLGNDKYSWEGNWNGKKIRIYVDNYGHYMTVNVDGKRVANTHPTDQFIVPGEWLPWTLSHYPAAERKKETIEREQKARVRAELLSKLI